MHHQIARDRIVYVFDENVLGYVVSLGAFVSKVHYTVGGIEHQVYMENSDFIELGENNEEV